MIYFILWIVAIIAILIFVKGASIASGGCGGSCNQGRTKCDCKKYF